MTLDELKALKPGDRVRFDDRGEYPAVDGKVNAADARCVELYWPDGMSSLIWFAHAERGMDTRHQHITKLPKGGKPAKPGGGHVAG